jgi:hypothetical protein
MRRYSPSVYQLRVQVSYIEPPIWRRLRVPGQMTVRDLHHTLQAAMGWDNYHLHTFEGLGMYFGHEGTGWAHDPCEKPRQLTLDDLRLSPGVFFEYLYDFGDNWLHEIEVEQVMSAEGESCAMCVGGRGGCPEKDSGGPSLYMERLRRRGRRPQGQPFNVVSVNAELRKLKTGENYVG